VKYNVGVDLFFFGRSSAVVGYFSKGLQKVYDKYSSNDSSMKGPVPSIHASTACKLTSIFILTSVVNFTFCIESLKCQHTELSRLVLFSVCSAVLSVGM